MRAIRATEAALVAVGIVHLTQVSDALEEQPYIGILFILTAAGAGVVAL